MLRFPAISCSINGHQCKPLWLKSLPRKGRMEAGQVQKSSSEQNPCKAPVGSLFPKWRFLTAPGTPRASWAPEAPSSAGGSCLQGLPSSPGGCGTGVRGAGPGQVYWESKDSCSVTGSSVVASRLLGCRKGRFEHLVELEPWDWISLKCWFGGIPGLLEGGNGDDHHSPGLDNITSVSSGKGLASGELGDAADVGLCQPLSSCSQPLPTNKIFK